MTGSITRRQLLAATGAGAAGLLAARLWGASASADQRLPNFVVILGEGHGWASTSVRMDDAVPGSKNAHVRTPNLEKLAAAGMRLSSFYAASPRCTPSRAALLTGRSPAQLHMTFIGEGRKDSGENVNGRIIPPIASIELPADVMTIAHVLGQAGYATAHFGKWHLGRTDPGRHGFDASDGPTSNGGPENVENPHPKQLYGMTERGLNLISQQAKADQPFYLQLSHYASRQGGDASPEALTAVKNWGGNLSERDIAEAAADLDLDIALGLLLRKLDDLSIAGNTYVIFTTDHGTPGRNPPLAGGKGTISEGGLRVPFIIRGPGIKPGACCRTRATDVDLLPTIAELAHRGRPLPAGLEGGSLVPLLKGDSSSVKRPREEFVVHFPHYDKDSIGPASAIYLGEFKLIRAYETGALRLFNVAADPGERRDLANVMPEKARELDRRLTDYLTAVAAQLPSPNPNYNAPNPAAPARGAERRKGSR